MIIKEEDTKTELTIENDRLIIYHVFLEEQEDGTELEGSSSRFSLPLDKVKELIEGNE